MYGKVRKWCACQMKCKEDNDMTWTCTAHLAEGRAFQCHADPGKVTVNKEGFFRHMGGCEDFEPPGYDCNDPEAFGPAPKKPARKQVEAERTTT